MRSFPPMKAAQQSEPARRGGPIRLCQSSLAHSLTLTFSEGPQGRQPSSRAQDFFSLFLRVFLFLLFSPSATHCVCVYTHTSRWIRVHSPDLFFQTYIYPPHSIDFLYHIIFYPLVSFPS